MAQTTAEQMAEGGHVKQGTKARETADVLYWKTRAESRKMLATYDNVQSCLLALRAIANLAEATVRDGEKQRQLSHEEALERLAAIQSRASTTCLAIETTERKDQQK
jgi:hypothetical protein